MKILVAEDDSISLRVIEAILKKLGHELKTVTNGKEAIEFLNKDGAVDLIISDIMMPEIDGLGVLKFIKSKRRFNKIPIILTTALNDMHTVQTAIKNGVTGYLVKPIKKDSLIAKLDEVIKSQPASILVVDDEEIIRSLLQRIIVSEGYKVITASGGAEALEIINDNKISLVVSDIKMPNMSGIELLMEVKSCFTNIKVIMMTGFSLEFSSDQAISSGADDFITKPFKNTEILQKIRKNYSKQKAPAKT